MSLHKRAQDICGDPRNHRNTHGVAETRQSLYPVSGDTVFVWHALQARVFPWRHGPHPYRSLARLNKELLAASPHGSSQATGQIIIADFGSLFAVATSAEEGAVGKAVACGKLIDAPAMGFFHHIEMAVDLMLGPPTWV